MTSQKNNDVANSRSDRLLVSVFAGRVHRIIQHVVAVIWDGPEKLVVFYGKELGGYGRMLLATIPLTLLQGMFWAWFFSLGHSTVLALFHSLGG